LKDIQDYNDIEEIVKTVLEKLCGIKEYNITDVLSCDDIFIRHVKNIIKRGKPNYLSYSSDNGVTWHDIIIDEDDKYCIFYKLSEIKLIIAKLSKTNN
jgi:hypothetical protein